MNFEFEYNGKKIKGMDTLPYLDVENMITAIANSCFDDGNYLPYRKEYFIWYMILRLYTDIDVENMTSDEVYVYIDDERFRYCLMDHINKSQFKRINSCVDELIRAKLNESPLHNVMNKLGDLLSAGKDVLIAISKDEHVVDKITEALGGKEAVEQIIEGIKNIK